jgi:hypothetical protein
MVRKPSAMPRRGAPKDRPAPTPSWLPWGFQVISLVVEPGVDPGTFRFSGGRSAD